MQEYSTDLLKSTINSFYLAILRRNADVEALNFYSDKYFNENFRLESILWEILECEEAKNLKKNAYGNYQSYYQGRPVFFMHFEKCAGTSIIQEIANLFAPWQIYQDGISNGYNSSHLFATGHLSIDFIDYFSTAPFLFVCLRSPKERIYSLYNYWVKRGFFSGNYSEFIHSESEDIVIAIDNIYLRRVLPKSTLVTHSTYYNHNNDDQKFIELALEKYSKFDVVLDFNNLSKCAAKLKHFLPALNFEHIKHVNQSQASDKLDLNLSPADEDRLNKLIFFDSIIYDNFKSGNLIEI